MKLPRKPYYEKELTLRLARSYGPGRYDPLYEEAGIDYPLGYVRWTEQRNMQEFLRLVATGAVRLGPLTTHRFAVDEAAKAYDCVQGKAGELAVGVLLEYPQSGEEGGGRLALPAKRGCSARPRRAPASASRSSAPATSPPRPCCRAWSATAAPTCAASSPAAA